VRLFVTGATGFIGAHVAERLRSRGDDVVALVRSLATAGALRELGCELVQGQLTDGDAVRAGVSGCDGIVHIAAAYKPGVTHDECRDMQRSNVGGTETIFEAGVDAGIDRILYVSTINYFGNTFGRVLNEGDELSSMDFLSCYDETKYRRICSLSSSSDAVPPSSSRSPGRCTDTRTTRKLDA
jgi:dihydroflavonol-4-reductase